MGDDDEDGPVVELGEGPDVEGAPLARVTSRLTWPAKRSRIRELEGESTIRTPEGPRRLADVLDELAETYFDRRQTFESAVRDVVGRGPVRTVEDADGPGDDGVVGDGTDGTGDGTDADDAPANVGDGHGGATSGDGADPGDADADGADDTGPGDTGGSGADGADADGTGDDG